MDAFIALVMTVVGIIVLVLVIWCIVDENFIEKRVPIEKEPPKTPIKNTDRVITTNLSESLYGVETEEFKQVAEENSKEIKEVTCEIYELVIQMYTSVGFTKGQITHGKLNFSIDTLAYGSGDVSRWDSIRLSGRTVLENEGKDKMKYGNTDILRDFLYYFQSENILDKIAKDVKEKHEANLEMKDITSELGVKIATYKKLRS